MSYAQAVPPANPFTRAAPDTKQLRILKALTALLEGCVYATYDADGSQYTLTGRVFRGKLLFSASQPVPYLSILEGKRPDSQPDYVGTGNVQMLDDWPLLLQGWDDDSPDTPLDNLYRLMGLVEQRLSLVTAVNQWGEPLDPQHHMLGGLLTGMLTGPGVVRPGTEEVGGVEAFYLPLTVIFAKNVADPFTVA